jgi:hypothetical protein
MLRLVFAVGPREIRDFRMIERHYFRNKVSDSHALCGPISFDSSRMMYTVGEELRFHLRLLHSGLNEHLGCSL